MKSVFDKYKVVISLLLLFALFVSTNGLTEAHALKKTKATSKKEQNNKQENVKPGTDLQHSIQGNALNVECSVPQIDYSVFAPIVPQNGISKLTSSLIFFRKILFEHIISAQAP